MINSQHPLVKAASYAMLGLIGSAVKMWSPAEALVICSVAFASDGLISSVLPAAKGLSSMSARLLSFLVPLLGLLVGRGLASLLGLA